MRRTLIALTVLLIAGCGSPGTETDPTAAATTSMIAVTGSVSIDQAESAADIGSVPGNCALKNSDGDITDGGIVTVTGPDGNVVSLGKLGTGSTTDGISTPCVFPLTATVPAGLKFYGIVVGHRDVIQVPEAELSHITITFGS